MTQEYEVETCLKGHFLIAMPGLEDPNFLQTVTYLCEHNKEGAVGLVINRVHPGIDVGLILKGLEVESVPGLSPFPIHFGKRTRWSRFELIAWIQAECPDRKKWQEIKNFS